LPTGIAEYEASLADDGQPTQEIST